MKSRIAILVCLIATLALSMSLAAAGPNPNQPYIQNITYGGTGCPNGSVATSLSSERTTATLIFDSFVASSGHGVPVTEGRKNCQLNLNLHLPSGSGQFCAAVTYRGYVQLPAGMQAESKAVYYNNLGPGYELPDGQVITIGDEDDYDDDEDNPKTLFTGPVTRDYRRRDPLEL